MSLYLDIEKRLNEFTLKVQLEAGDEVVSFLGASGCGKSMTLKCIAGIERPDRGRIVLDDTVLYDSERHIDLPPQKRRTGLLFQNYALFPNMTVRQNIYTGTNREKDKALRLRKVEEIMERFDLTPLADRLPARISGGQQQRTALARLLVSDPGILMLDEPFSALDSHLRFRMEQEVRGIIRDFGKTVLMVSHDRDEVFRMSDKVAIMDRGRIEVYGDRANVFAEPGTRNACIMTGCKNITPVRKLSDHKALAEDWGLELVTAEPVGDAAYIGIRHHDIDGGDAGSVNCFLCDVAEVIENPFSYTVMLRLAGHPGAGTFGWELDKDAWSELRSDQVRIHIPPDTIMLLKE